MCKIKIDFLQEEASSHGLQSCSREFLTIYFKCVEALFLRSLFGVEVSEACSGSREASFEEPAALSTPVPQEDCISSSPSLERGS